jgi:hypothetical protein
LPFAIGAAGAGAIGSVVGGGKQANATKQAAQTQAGAANNATQLQRDEFNQVQSNEAPYQAMGTAAVNELAARRYDLTFGDFGQFNPSKEGLSSQFDPAQSGLSAQFNPAQAGLPAQFSYNANDFQNDPAFQSSMKLGQQAMERSAAAKGGLLGGAEQKSLDQFGVDTANQYYNQDYNRAQNTYQQSYANAQNTYNSNYNNAQNTYQQNYSNAFNTFNSNRDSIFNKLSTLSGLGQSAASGTNAAGMNAANNSSEIALGAGNSAAAGIIGQANAGASAAGGVSSSLSGLLNSPSFQNLLQQHAQTNSSASSYAKNANYDYSSES